MSRSVRLAIGTIAILLVEATAPGILSAGERPNLLVIGQDAGPNAVPRDGRTFERALQTLSGELHEVGLGIFDETVFGSKGVSGDQAARSEIETIDLARSVRRPPLDAALFLSAYARGERLSYATRVNVRLMANLVDIRTGRRLSAIELEMAEPLWVSVTCDRRCVLGNVGVRAVRLSRELAGAVAERLGAQAVSPIPGRAARDATPIGYTLVFEGFSAEVISEIEEYLVAFAGYQDLRPVNAHRGHHEFWYESDLGSRQLIRSLYGMLDHIRVDGHIDFSRNVLTVDINENGQATSRSWDDW